MREDEVLTLNRMKYLLVTRYQVQRHEIDRRSDFVTDFKFSYVQFTSLSMRVEEAFDIKLRPHDARKLRTVGQMIDRIMVLQKSD